MVSKKLQDKFYAALESLKDGKNDYILEALAAGAKATFEGIVSLDSPLSKRFDKVKGKNFPTSDRKFRKRDDYPMVSEAITKLGNTIDAMKTDDNASLLEAIKEGYRACFEGMETTGAKDGRYTWTLLTPIEDEALSEDTFMELSHPNTDTSFPSLQALIDYLGDLKICSGPRDLALDYAVGDNTGGTVAYLLCNTAFDDNREPTHRCRIKVKCTEKDDPHNPYSPDANIVKNLLTGAGVML